MCRVAAFLGLTCVGDGGHARIRQSLSRGVWQVLSEEMKLFERCSRASPLCFPSAIENDCDGFQEFGCVTMIPKQDARQKLVFNIWHLRDNNSRVYGVFASLWLLSHLSAMSPALCFWGFQWLWTHSCLEIPSSLAKPAVSHKQTW